MRRAVLTIAFAMALAAPTLVLPQPGKAQFASEQRQAECELSAIGSTRSLIAIQRIRSACNWLAVNEGSLLNESLRPFYLCLVQNLSGAQSDVAAAAIENACRTSNLR